MFGRDEAALAADCLIETDGPNGLTVYFQSGTTHFPSRATTVVDVTGAGDAFLAGFTAALLRDQSHREAIEQGLAAAAHCCSQIGVGDPGMAE